jgi:hypothetical protein
LTCISKIVTVKKHQSWICLTTAAIELLCKIVSVAYVTPLVFGQMLITSMIVDTSLPIPLILQKLFM